MASKKSKRTKAASSSETEATIQSNAPSTAEQPSVPRYPIILAVCAALLAGWLLYLGYVAYKIHF